MLDCHLIQISSKIITVIQFWSLARQISTSAIQYICGKNNFLEILSLNARCRTKLDDNSSSWGFGSGQLKITKMSSTNIYY